MENNNQTESPDPSAGNNNETSITDVGEAVTPSVKGGVKTVIARLLEKGAPPQIVLSCHVCGWVMKDPRELELDDGDDIYCPVCVNILHIP